MPPWYHAYLPDLGARGVSPVKKFGVFMFNAAAAQGALPANYPGVVKALGAQFDSVRQTLAALPTPRK